MTHHHLKFIELDEVSFEDVNEVLVMLQMIVNSPNLETLQVSVSCSAFQDTCFCRFEVCLWSVDFSRFLLLLVYYETLMTCDFGTRNCSMILFFVS